jgi:hypothetical protein
VTIGGHGSVEGTIEYFARLAGNAAEGIGKRGFGVWLDDRPCGYVDLDPDLDLYLPALCKGSSRAALDPR